VFVRRHVWHVTFLEPGLQTPLPKTLTFKDEGKIRELARRGLVHVMVHRPPSQMHSLIPAPQQLLNCLIVYSQSTDGFRTKET
jgi:hypothetical protein